MPRKPKWLYQMPPQERADYLAKQPQKVQVEITKLERERDELARQVKRFSLVGSARIIQTGIGGSRAKSTSTFTHGFRTWRNSMNKRPGPGMARTEGTVTVIPTFEIPEALEIFRDKEDSRLFEVYGLSYLAYDLVYNERGYSTEDPAYGFAPPRYVGAAATLARELAPLVGWPCWCSKRERIVEFVDGFSTLRLEIFCNGNPWIAPWQAVYSGPTPYIERRGKEWAREQFSRIAREVQGVVEALAFFNATGQAVLPRRADEGARTRYVRGGPVPEFYPRIQDIEQEYAGWSRW